MRHDERQCAGQEDSVFRSGTGFGRVKTSPRFVRVRIGHAVRIKESPSVKCEPFVARRPLRLAFYTRRVHPDAGDRSDGPSQLCPLAPSIVVQAHEHRQAASHTINEMHLYDGSRRTQGQHSTLDVGSHERIAPAWAFGSMRPVTILCQSNRHDDGQTHEMSRDNY
jgi:hypothetical protein